MVKAKPALCGKEGDKLWITGGKMLSSEQASQLFHEMNGGKRVSLPKEPLYEHCNEDSLDYQSCYDLKSCGPYLWSIQGELAPSRPLHGRLSCSQETLGLRSDGGCNGILGQNRRRRTMR